MVFPKHADLIQYAYAKHIGSTLAFGFCVELAAPGETDSGRANLPFSAAMR
jgi:hypothetical protein